MRAAVLWTGGKDSALAFYKAQIAGYEVTNLLTFVPEAGDFLAHPISFMKYQAEAIGIPHLETALTGPLDDAYEEAILSFKEEHRTDVLITGDIAEVDGLPNWIKERSVKSGVKVVMPLWGYDRRLVFAELFLHGFKTIISCIKKGSLTREWLGRELDRTALESLQEIHNKTGLDICGEQGEYHTLALDGPFFKKSITIGSYTKDANDLVEYIKPKNMILQEKA